MKIKCLLKNERKTIFNEISKRCTAGQLSQLIYFFKSYVQIMFHAMEEGLELITVA